MPAAVPLPSAPRKPAAHAEGALVSRILAGDFPPDSTLPPERELALALGVTRPTLREALQRLDRDGWIQVRHGKATRVRDVWREGGLNVLAALVRNGGPFPPNFVSKLLEVRLAMAPSYAGAAVAKNGPKLAAVLARDRRPADDAEAFAQFDWDLHVALTALSDNPVFTLILNGFGDFYTAMARWYFEPGAARRASSAFYDELLAAAKRGQAGRAEAVTRAAMAHSLTLWRATERRLEKHGLVPP